MDRELDDRASAELRALGLHGCELSMAMFAAIQRLTGAGLATEMVDDVRFLARSMARVFRRVAEEPSAETRNDGARLLADAVRIVRFAMGDTMQLLVEPHDDRLLLQGDPVDLVRSFLSVLTPAIEAARGRRATLVVSMGRLELDSPSTAGEVVLAAGSYVTLEVRELVTGFTADAQGVQLSPSSFCVDAQGGAFEFIPTEDGLAPRLLLPAAAGSEKVVVLPAAPRPRTNCVLIASTDGALRREIAAELRSSGHHIVVARDAERAQEVLSKGVPVDTAVVDEQTIELDTPLLGRTGVVPTLVFRSESATSQDNLERIAGPWSPTELLDALARLDGRDGDRRQVCG